MVAGRQGKRHGHQATAARASRKQAIPGHRITLRSRVPAIVADDEGKPTWHRPRHSPFRRVERRSSCLSSAFIACPTFDFTKRDPMEDCMAVRRWSPDMRSSRIAAYPVFFTSGNLLPGCPTTQKHPPQAATVLVPSHPPSWTADILIGAPRGHSLHRHGYGLHSCFANFPNKTVLRPTKTYIAQGPQGSAQIRDKSLPPSARRYC